MTISSTSASERPTLEHAGTWRRFALVLVAGTAVIFGAALAVTYVVDPYDTGRPGLFVKPGTQARQPSLANASRGRDPSFTGAIVGNSHIALISPERLRTETGIPFVQLSAPATAVREHLALLDWFLRHHQDTARALVFGIDSAWCTSDPTLPISNPFPLWLYSANTLEYVRGLVRFSALEDVTPRLRYLLSRDLKRERPDGYWDYEPIYGHLGYDTNPELRARLEQRPSDDSAENSTGRFPAVERLRAALEGLPPEVQVVLVFPPVYTALLPQPGTVRAKAEEACKAAFAQLAERPRTAVVDWRVDRLENRDADLFFDRSHYRQPIARLVEDDIAAALRRR